MIELSDKVIIVTGGARGNGEGIANGFIEAGAKVICLDLLDGKNKNIEYIKVDLTCKDDIKQFIDDIYNKYGKIDVLVNNAGISVGNPSEIYSLSDWENTILVNLTVPFLLSQFVGKKMIKSINEGVIKGGSIINITSLGAEFGFPNNPAYCVSKGGLKQLTKALAYDWAKYGIRVNSVGPGYMKTDMTKLSFSNPEMKAKRDAHIMLDRWGEPRDLAGVCQFLASDLSAYITAQSIYVDGGWTAKGL